MTTAKAITGGMSADETRAFLRQRGVQGLQHAVGYVAGQMNTLLPHQLSMFDDIPVKIDTSAGLEFALSERVRICDAFCRDYTKMRISETIAGHWYIYGLIFELRRVHKYLRDCHPAEYRKLVSVRDYCLNQLPKTEHDTFLLFHFLWIKLI
jgi:hypothetical protein